MNQDDGCVYVAAGDIDAQQVKMFLEAKGVPCEMRGEALRVTHALTLNGLGEVRIHVAPERIAEARDLLARVEAGELALEDGHEGP